MQADDRQDADLVSAMCSGDNRALTVFYDRHAPVVFATCVRILGDRAAADDLLIDIFFEFWRRAAAFDATRSRPLTYLLTLTRSRAIDRKRSMRRHTAGRTSSDSIAATISASTDSGGLKSAIADETLTQIRAAVTELPVVQRQAIEHAFYDGMTHTEIAERLGKPLGTIKTYIRQGMLQLRAAMVSTGVEAGDATAADGSLGE